MEALDHPLASLFKQLGLSEDFNEIEFFISVHSPLKESILLAEASFWNFSQKKFLKDELLKDAEWSGSIDILNAQLRNRLRDFG